MDNTLLGIYDENIYHLWSVIDRFSIVIEFHKKYVIRYTVAYSRHMILIISDIIQGSVEKCGYLQIYLVGDRYNLLPFSTSVYSLYFK